MRPEDRRVRTNPLLILIQKTLNSVLSRFPYLFENYRIILRIFLPSDVFSFYTNIRQLQVGIRNTPSQRQRELSVLLAVS